MVQEYRAHGAPPPIPEDDPTPAGGPHRYKWVFHAPPVTGPGGHVPFQVPEEWADDLGQHLENLSFWQRDDLVRRAGPDGMLNVLELPEARMRQDPPLAGPSNWLNPGPWVPVSTPAPARQQTEVDLNELTDEQAEAIRVEADAVQEALRRREVWKARLAEADPDSTGGAG
ncbi:MAG: hypothetical protein U1C73_14410 [Dietzia sp.]|nr:hypothetical protein [Dietzia sp.]